MQYTKNHKYLKNMHLIYNDLYILCIYCKSSKNKF